MRTRLVESGDRTDLLRMRQALWPGLLDDHVREIDEFLLGRSKAIDQVFICEADDRSVIGFIELRIRNCAEGSENTEVPYVEGWYIDSGHRRCGAGALLIAQAEQWAKTLGYSELGSDTEIENHGSIAAHLALGFEEVERLVCFLKKL
jgi:aminoglycoside 6'-N-acetyltransferase I